METTPVAPAPEFKETIPVQTRDSVTVEPTNGKDVSDGESLVKPESIQEPDDQAEQVVQSIEVRGPLTLSTDEFAKLSQEPKEMSRRQTMDSASGNDPDMDDDIEITVGTYEPSVPKERSQVVADERDQAWDGPQSHPPPLNRKGSTAQPRQEQNYDNSFGFDGNGPNMDMPPNEAMVQMQNFMQMMHQNGMNPQNMPFRELSCLYMSYCMMDSNGPLVNNNPNPNHLQAQMQTQMQSMMQGFMANMSSMQNMGMPMMNFPGWGGPGMNGFQNFQGMQPNMMGNGASYNQGPQQYQQNYGDHRPNFNQRNSSFGYPSRGRGKNRGRGRGGAGAGAYQHNQQDSYAYNNNMPFTNQYGQNQNQFNQGSVNFTQPQYDQNSSDAFATNQSKDHEHTADDNDFAPGGQEEVEEALGDEYKKKTPTPVAETKAEEPPPTDVKDEYQEEPSTEIEHIPAVESPAPYQEPEEKYIPEAYREDLGESYSAAPPSAPSGPSAKNVPFRERGHGRFPSRGRGSYHGPNGYAPRSPARPVSQHQTNSPTTNAGFGVVGAPTGPRAMREKDAPHAPMKQVTRTESDVGIKIRGTATQPRRDDVTRSATPKSTYDDYGERDRETSSRRHSKYDKKEDSRYSSNYNSQNHTELEEYESSRDKKRRKSSRREVEDDYYDNDHEMQDTEVSETQDRSHRDRSRRDRERDKDKSRDKYSSSTSKAHKTSSSRRHEDTYDDYDGANDHEPSDERTTSRSAAKKSSSKHDDRDDRERRDRDYERAEKDKYRKRSRHDREREDGYEDADEEESRRRSRKHKREHTSSRKDRDRDRDRGGEREKEDSTTDLGLRITGRSSKSGNGSQSQNVSEAPVVDKDPHTLEREARNRERMLKEQQRRENAEKSKGMGSSGGSGLSGGRTRTFKYEDEIERQLGRTTKRR